MMTQSVDRNGYINKMNPTIIVTFSRALHSFRGMSVLSSQLGPLPSSSPLKLCHLCPRISWDEHWYDRLLVKHNETRE
jgi:hypothetical protein